MNVSQLSSERKRFSVSVKLLTLLLYFQTVGAILRRSSASFKQKHVLNQHSYTFLVPDM